MAKLTKIFGPPGTGKTHRLLQRVKAYVRTGTPYHQIGYFAFTKKASGVARDRVGVSEKQVPYFQTIHAFCFHRLNMNEEQIMQPYNYEEIGKLLGIRVNYSDKYNDEETHYLTCNNPYFQMIGKAINLDIPIRDLFDKNEHDRKQVGWTQLKNIALNLERYKKINELMDFNDLISTLIERQDKIPQFKAIFVDEAQDLSPLQWKLIDVLKTKTEHLYLAGDDDQAIYAWAGADVSRFITEPAREIVLKHSRRISRAVQQQSEIPISRIAGIRKQKKYLPRPTEGSAQHINNLGQINLKEGKWLILSRTKSNLLTIMEELRRKNLYYESNKGKSFTVGIYKAAVAYTKWRTEETLETTEINDIRDYIPNAKFWNKDKEWYDVFTAAPHKEVLYIRNMLADGEKLNHKARIFVSTIHAAKGGEEDNVILSLHQSSKVQKGIKQSVDKQDEEHRVWYVGISRARNNLYKLKAKKVIKEYKL
jgi:superfamily I DNA/RNA helicase